MRNMLFLGLLLLNSIWLNAQTGHGGDAAKQNEHDKFMALIPVANATHTALGGSWNSPSTWAGGSVPNNDSRVHIPDGVTVTVDAELVVRHKWIRVDGKLQFATNLNTKLLVETLGITDIGELEIGTSANPIQSAVKSHIVFIDNGNIDITYDPLLLSRGLISHGTVRMYGEWKTPFVKAAQWIAPGQSTIQLASTPQNWRIGDQIVLSGIFSKQSEEFTIAGINGTQLTLNKNTIYDRRIKASSPLFNGMYPYVAHYSRNIIFESENKTDVHRRGHVMFMHHQDVNVQNVLFKELGRTNKAIEFTKTATSSTSNMIGRYAVHFHRAGDMEKDGNFAYTKGCAVWGSPGWGFVNHESHVWFDDNSSYNVFGSHFTDENGTELGGFRRNIAILSTGSASFAPAEKNRQPGDHGHTGVGFWATTGASVRMEGNVATDQNMAGFAIISRKTPDDAHNYNPKLYDDSAVGGGVKEIHPQVAGMHFFRDNTSYGASHGLAVIDLELNGMINSKNLFENFNVLNPLGGNGIDIEYARNIEFKNCKILRDDQTLSTDQWNGYYAIKAHSTFDHRFSLETKSWTYIEGVKIYGFVNALANLRNSGSNAIDDGKFYVIGANNELNIKSGGHIATLSDPQHFRNVAEASAIPSRPVFSVAPGSHAGPVNVVIQSDPGTTVYFIKSKVNYEAAMYDFPLLASITEQLAMTSAFQYNGQNIVMSDPYNVIFAIAVKDGIQSRISAGWYYIGSATPPPVAVTGVSITTTPNPLTLQAGADQLLTYEVLPSLATNKNVTWTSSNPSIVSVAANGTVAALAVGTATITVKTTDGNFTASIVVNVIAPAPFLTLGASAMNFAGAAATQNLTVSSNVQWTATDNASWLSISPVSGSNAGVIAVTTTENLTGAARTGNITVSGGGYTSSVTVTQTSNYTLNVTATNGIVAKSPDQASYNSNATVNLTATAASGYTFSGWSGDASGTSNPLTVTMDANKNITANFTVSPTPTGYRYYRYTNSNTGALELAEIQYMVGNTSYPSPKLGYNSPLASPINTYSSYDGVSSWGPTISANGTTVVDLGAVRNIDAVKITPVYGTLNAFSIHGATSATGPWELVLSKNGLTQAGGTTVSYSFGSNTPPVASYTLNVNGSNGSVAKSPNQAFYSSGSTVTLTATPATGYVFSSWSGDATGSNNPLTVTMNGNKNITANFTAVTYTLNVSAANGSVTRSPNQTSYNNGSTVTLTATAASGYTFSGWSGDASGTANPLTVTMDANKTITANFMVSQTPKGYRYYKFTMLTTTNGEIAEIDYMLGSTAYPTPKLAYGSILATSSVGNPYAAYDGVTSWGPIFSNNAWSVVDLGAILNIGAVKLTLPSWGRLQAFKIEGSLSASGPWTLLLNRSGISQAGGSVTYNFSSGTNSSQQIMSAEMHPDLTSSDVVLYPNPLRSGSAILKINKKDLHEQFEQHGNQRNHEITNIMVFDLEGKLILTGTTHSNVIEIKRSQLKPGVYFIKVQSGNIHKQLKLFVQ